MSISQASGDPSEEWSLIIKPHTKWWDLQLGDVWRYRDLLWLFVRRDFVAVYKQTVLGPIWFIIQPILTTLMFVVIFGNIAKIPTGGFPPILFYLAGITPWNYFSGCLLKTSNTFIQNAGIFGKVYFPRLISPLSVVISSLIQFMIQFVLFLGFLLWFGLQGAKISPNYAQIFLLTPALLLMMGMLGLGAGIVISSLTTKYRDFTHLVAFGIQLAMYATPVIYPVSQVPEKYRWIINLNPMSPIIESFRAIYMGGAVPWNSLSLAAGTTSVLLLLGILIFNKVEKSFMDTV
ncbi:MAG: ABC transporter permease [Akkermansiaceae bacterium]|nr:ABC transporter permease [Akkermansiaceae bacterium]